MEKRSKITLKCMETMTTMYGVERYPTPQHLEAILAILDGETIKLEKMYSNSLHIHRIGPSPTRPFTDTAFHIYGLSPTRPFTDTAFSDPGDPAFIGDLACLKNIRFCRYMNTAHFILTVLRHLKLFLTRRKSQQIKAVKPRPIKYLTSLFCKNINSATTSIYNVLWQTIPCI